MKPMLELVGLHRAYTVGEGSVPALRGVSLQVERGEFVAIMGASGSGKSTLLHILGLLDKPDSGSYAIDGVDVGALSEEERAVLRNGFAGFVFQQFHLLRRMSVIDNVCLPHAYSSQMGEARRDAAARLERVGMGHRSGHMPNQLSGGEQQRVAIARALVHDPMLIFADEPTGNLDSKNSHEIMALLKELNEEGRTIVMVTHEAEVAAWADRVITMRDGLVLSDERCRPADGTDAPKAGTVAAFPFREAARSAPWSEGRLGRFVSQAFQSMGSNKVRSFLSVLGILVGVASVIAMMALGEGAKQAMQEELKSLGSNLLSVRGGSAKIRGAARGEGAVARFTFNDVRDIADLSGLVNRASGTVNGSARIVYGNRNWSSTLDGVGYDYGQMRAAIPVVGRWFSREEIRRRDKVAIIGSTVAGELFGSASPLGKTVKINRLNFRVIGIAPPKGFSGHRDGDDVVMIPVTTAMYRVLGKEYLNYIYVEIAEAALIGRGKETVASIIRRNHRLGPDDDAFNIRDMTELQEMLSSTTRTMSLLLGSIAAISLVVGGIGIMNIMLVSVTERTREIGLRKALGARKGDIMLQFLVESACLTVAGGSIGVLGGLGAAWALSIFAGWSVSISPAPVLLASIFSVAIGLLFGLWPAWKAAALRPVEALRYE